MSCCNSPTDSVVSSIPTVELSADAMPSPIDAASRAGFLAYLTKPLNIGEFLGKYTRSCSILRILFRTMAPPRK